MRLLAVALAEQLKTGDRLVFEHSSFLNVVTLTHVESDDDYVSVEWPDEAEPDQRMSADIPTGAWIITASE